jgi:hypothetical protein
MQTFPALQFVPLHGCPATPLAGHDAPTHPPGEAPPLPPEAEPPLLLPDEEPPPLLLLPGVASAPLLPLDMDPPLLAPSEPASGAGVEVTAPPHPRSDAARKSPLRSFTPEG